MSRAKSRQNVDVCGDCGSPEPMWASVNKGILLCIQCCHTHRSLGRHISIVKSLNKSHWEPSQLAMVRALNDGGVNSIWEHALEKDTKLAKRKPQPADSLEDKAKFIKSKHQNCEFLFRPNCEDGICIENELGKQLHASVRSNNLITSFRLLIQGADSNYFHDEKNSTPLHAAVKANQLLQVELLLVYGADPTYPDAAGKTPIDYARQGINKNIANSLIESQYEVTDKFSYYLCHRKPDHDMGVDFLIPPTVQKSNPTSMEKLKKLSNLLFEELVKDVFDEVDRREIEAIWLGSADTIELSAVPFLPVDPSLSSTRNQSRQKLGRFASPELKALVHDILVDSQRRQKLSEKGQPRQLSQISDDDPLYDSVASDDDYAIVPPISEEEYRDAKLNSLHQTDHNQNPIPVSDLEKQKYEMLYKKLMESNSTIVDLKSEVSNLKALVEHLSSVNHELKVRVSHAESNSINGNRSVVSNGDSGSQSLDGYLLSRPEDSSAYTSLSSLTNGRLNENNNSEADRNSKKIQRPSSMYETREGLRTPNWQAMKNQLKQNEQTSRATPQNQTIMQCTEQVTKGISDLWKCIQSSGGDNCMLYADKIRFAVTNLVKAVPLEKSRFQDTVKHLLETVSHLQTNCIGLQYASKSNDKANSEMYIQKVRSSAYEIAKDTKALVTKYNSH